MMDTSASKLPFHIAISDDRLIEGTILFVALSFFRRGVAWGLRVASGKAKRKDSA